MISSGIYIIIITIQNYYYILFYFNPRTSVQLCITQVHRYNMYPDLQRRIRSITYLLCSHNIGASKTYRNNSP